MTSEQLDQVLPVVKPDPKQLSNPDPDAIQTTWIGHASALVQMEGVTFLTDPIFSERCSPFQWIGPKRIRKVPLEIEELPPLSFVVISVRY
jgi:N-acyl-phosphatidylethanolamine-hydrolysing phospholipase D